jgi:hypothetical protein
VVPIARLRTHANGRMSIELGGFFDERSADIPSVNVGMIMRSP